MLYRSVKDRYLGGVFGGIGRALCVSPWFFRVVFVAFLITRVLILPALAVYFLCWFFLPERRDGHTQNLSVRGLSPNPNFRIYRSRKHRILGGVCGGIAHHYGIRRTFLRLGVVAFVALTAGWGSLLYLLATLILPSESQEI